MNPTPKIHRLTFRATDVAELVAHATAAKKHRAYYEDMGVEKDNPSIYLVSDHGVYLMSGGQPSMKVHGSKGHIRVFYAHGYDPYTLPFESWYGAKRDLNTRGDFSLRIPLRKLTELTPDTTGFLTISWEDGQDCMIFGPDNYSITLDSI